MTDEPKPKFNTGGVIRPGAGPLIETGPAPYPIPRTITDDEYRRIERRWRWAVKAQGNALRILNPDGSHGGWLGRRPPWWKRAYYRVRMWLA